MLETPGALATMIYSLPYAVVITGMALSWRFNRSKIFFILLVLAISYWSVGRLVAEQSAVFSPYLDGQFIQAILCVLLPLNFLIFSSIKERGIFNSRGLARLGFVLTQVLLVYWLWEAAGERALPVLQYRIWSAPWLLQTNISQVGIVFFLAALLVLAYRIARVGATLDYGMTATLLLIAYFLHEWKSTTLIWFVAAAAAILVISLVQDAYRKAYVDELTGLPGRRSMEEYFLKLTGMYSVAMVDIDHFKKCNDRYGHDVGDQVLRMIATFLKQVSRGGKPFRYGGEEFVIVFPGKEIEEVHSALDILRQSIGDNRFVIRSFFRSQSKPEIKPERENQKRLGVTVSIGCTQRTNDDYLPVDVIKRADKALYQAKETGRNRVCVC